ncbi:MAG: hypothetical protein H6774_01575 [Pseudomonadales bacterium]|nr:hypothetical protein [Pseudomonadales bacterium]
MSVIEADGAGIKEKVKVGEGQLIGYSLSFCVLDIVHREVREDQVEKIISGTNAESEEAWEKLLSDYKNSYWKDHADVAEEIARRLYESGKLEQPRTKGENGPNISNGYWKPLEE